VLPDSRQQSALARGLSGNQKGETRMPRISRFLLFAATLLFSISAFASSHREAPLITEDPTMDNCDVYAFRSPDAPDTITIIANFSPLSEPSNGPNFYRFSPAGIYEIHTGPVL
jgi:hypothetical protein